MSRDTAGRRAPRRRWLAPSSALAVGLCLLAACTEPQPNPAPDATTATEAAAPVPDTWRYDLDTQASAAAQAMVVTDAPIASDVGLQVLRDGGNAIDAAVATAFALAVVYPEAGNIGGGGFLVLRLADGTEASLDFREKAPEAASRNMYLDADGELTDASLIGHRASGVPGSVAGLWAVHERFGSLPWSDLIAPAIELAERGFTVDTAFAQSVQGARDVLARFEASAALFLPEDVALPEGRLWRNQDLARVLERIASDGPSGFYAGATADLIAAEMERGDGLITREDLAAYEAVWRDPIAFDYRGYRVISMPPPSSGGITLALIANTLEGYDLAASGWRSTLHLHREAEAMRRAFADRNTYLGDPDFVEVPTATLISDDYAAQRRAEISDTHATASAGVTPGLGELIPASGAGIGGAESDHTTHFSIVDAAGNAIALTTTINALYGSGVTVAGGGFLLNNEMDDFTAKPGVENLYGLVQGEANAIEPGKRMLSAMTPTIVVDRAGQLFLVTGARGGPRIISAVFQLLSNVIDFALPLGAAVNAPRIHHQHLPDVLYFEAGGLSSEQITALATLGHAVEARDDYIGSAPTILRAMSGWVGLADPRQGGSAAGY